MTNSDIKILLVDDEPDILELVGYHLRREGYTVFTAPDGEQGIEIAVRETPSLIILDVMMPGMDGMETCERLRQIPRLKDTLVVFLTALAEDYSMMAGYEAGADDYILKPFHMSELIARLRAVVRRRSPLAPDVLRAGSLSLNTVTHACSVGSESVTLSKREYALLAALMTRPGAILSRRALEEKLYAPGDEPESNAVEYLIHSLRKKIGASAIENIRGLGWRVPADKNAAQ